MPHRRGKTSLSSSAARDQNGPTLTHFEGESVTMRAVGLAVKTTVKPVVTAWAATPQLPWPYALADYLGRPLRRVRGTTVRQVRLRHCSAEEVVPPGPAPSRHVLYLHGGAFVVGGKHLHRQLISKVAHAMAATALAVEYRKLPKHPIRSAIDDGLDGYRHLLAQGISPEQIIFVGDSAGGFLVFMTAIAALREGLPAPAGIVALSPLTDFDHAGKLDAPSADSCVVFSRRAVHTFGEFAHIDRTSGSSTALRLNSPVECDLHGLPPTLIQACTGEMLYPDAQLMARRLAESGVSCELQTWENSVHVFQAAAGIAPEAAQAVAQIGAFAERVAPATGTGFVERAIG